MSKSTSRTVPTGTMAAAFAVALTKEQVLAAYPGYEDKSLENAWAEAEWNNLMKAAEAFETTDSRFNEIVRVCSAFGRRIG